MVRRGFDATASKEDLQRVEERLSSLEQKAATKDDLARFEQHLIARLDTIRSDIADLDHLRERVAYLETLLHIER